MRAKRDLLAKYGADAILRAEVKADALAWKEKPAQLPGFSAAQWSQKLGVWLQRPKRNTVQGRAAAQEMDEVCEILEIWQWSLERALGVDGSVFGWYGNARLFLNTTARPLSDGAWCFACRRRTFPITRATQKTLQKLQSGRKRFPSKRRRGYLALRLLEVHHIALFLIRRPRGNDGQDRGLAESRLSFYCVDLPIGFRILAFDRLVLKFAQMAYSQRRVLMKSAVVISPIIESAIKNYALTQTYITTRPSMLQATYQWSSIPMR